MKKVIRWFQKQLFVFWILPFCILGVVLASFVQGFRFGMWWITCLINDLID